MSSVCHQHTKVLKLIRGKDKPIKLKFNFVCNFTKENPATGQIDKDSSNFSNRPVIVSEATNLSELYNTLTEIFLESIENFQNQSSNWQFDEVVPFSVNIDPYTPISAGSYIKLPKFLADKKAFINVINEDDNKCLKWAVTSAVYTRKSHPERLDSRMTENSKKFIGDGIEYPIDIMKGIDKFERQNPYKINVFNMMESQR